jgi:NAD(P)-dependent dehydrogenase (short-subunit alcohol dehydrogenase family)
MLGLSSGLAGGWLAGTRLTIHALIDRVGSLIGLRPHFVNAAAEPGQLGLMTAPGAALGYLKLVPKGNAFDQRVAARFVFDAMRYSPGKYLRHLTMPTLLQVANNDLTTPASAALRSARGARTVTLKKYDADHFDPYVEPLFSTFIAEQLDFLKQNVDSAPQRIVKSNKPTVFITGAAKGIGAETALLFAKQGYRVGVTDINQGDLDALSNALGNGHFYRQLDVTKPDDFVSALSEFAAENGGAIDVLINNAGIAFIDDYEAVPLAKHLAVTEVNVKGVQIGAYHALPYLRKSERPTMVNMCSLSSEYGVPSEASYSASKFWVKGFTEALNIEWERHGIHVCDVMPNFVATPMMDAAHGKIVESIGIFLQARDVSAVILKAVQNRTNVHWEVDTWWPRLLRTIGKLLPNTLRRTAMRHLSGY